MTGKWVALIAAIVLLVLVGCQPQAELEPSEVAERVSQAATPSRPPDTVTLPPPTPTAPSAGATPPPETPKPLPTAPSTVEGALSGEGPWWLFQTDDGLWALNPDGSGLTLVLDRSNSSPEAHAYHYAASPAGGLLALIEIEDRYAFSPPQLQLLSLPDGQITPITALHPAAPDAAADPDAYDRWVATGVLNTLAWSPDGNSLAFNGVIDGESGDLYTFSLTDGRLARLTSGPTESVFPTWSPDGRRIVHGSVVRLNTQMSGAGYDHTGVWSAAADGSAVDLLFESEIVGFENVLGWMGDSLLLMDSETPNENPFCSYSNLTQVGLENGQREPLVGGRYAARAFDPESQTVLFSVAGEPGCEGELRPGLYVLDVASGQPPTRFVEDVAWEIAWSAEAGLFFAGTDLGVLGIDTSGQFIDLVVPKESFGLPAVAPGSRRLAWSGNELWIGTLQDNMDQPPRLLHTGRIWEASWSADGQHLLYLTGDGVWIASEPDFTPLQVADLRGYSPIWVPPAGK
jgi:WD40 repeat protein